MTVQDTVRTVTVPRQAGPVEPPLPLVPPSAVAAPATAPLPRQARPLTADERQFAVALVALFLALEAIIVGGLLLAQYA